MEETKKKQETFVPDSVSEFDIFLPAVKSPDDNQGSGEKIEQIRAKTFAVKQILLWSEEGQDKLKTELENVYTCAFPKMSEKLRDLSVCNYFDQPCEKLHRQAVFLRNETNRLIGASRFDIGKIEYDSNVTKGIYFITRAILPEYQKFGLGKTIARKVLTDIHPDVLFVTCAQSPSLHSWIGLSKKGLVTDYEVYPRLEQKEGLITVPYKDLDFIISALSQTYAGVIKSRGETFEKILKNLTVLMARKNIFEEMYDFNPWEKSGREDKLAKALGLTEKDGVLVIFRKKHETENDQDTTKNENNSL